MANDDGRIQWGHLFPARPRYRFVGREGEWYRWELETVDSPNGCLVDGSLRPYVTVRCDYTWARGDFARGGHF